MNAMPLALMVTAAAAVAVGAAALHTTRGLRRQLTALRDDLVRATAASAPPEAGTVPAARAASTDATPRCRAATDEIRAAVADALAEERERELAEARAFWAAQEAKDAADASSVLDGFQDTQDPRGDELGDFLPGQRDFHGLEHLFAAGLSDPGETDAGSTPAQPTEPPADALAEEVGSMAREEADSEGAPVESPELAAARRRHPSHPDFSPVDGVSNGEQTVSRLAELADGRTPLADVRPGPLGTLDVYLFADGTTVCMTPSHRETTDRLVTALHAGGAPVLLGGSAVAGAYALTFSCGEESLYVLADRVVLSL